MPARKKARRTSSRKRSGVSLIKQATPFRGVHVSLAKQGRWDAYGTADDQYGMTLADATYAQKVNRARDGITGMGAYYGGAGKYNRLKKAQRWSGFASGLAKGGRSMLKGMGEYVYNSTFPSNSGMKTPEFQTVSDELGSVCVNYKEYLTDIFGNIVTDATTNNFSTVQYNIQPGLERTFPFLSQFAANFDEYDLKQCVFTYKSTINTDSSTTNGQVGSVIMCTNYIVGSLPFTDKNAMLQYSGSASARVTDTSVHGVECDPEKLSGTRGKYIRNSPVLVGKDPQLFDHAVFNLAISGTPEAFSNQPIGELWVEYTVILRKPKVLTGFGQAISKDMFYNSSPCTAPYWWPTTAAGLLTGQQNNIGVELTTSVQTLNGIQQEAVILTFPTWFTSPTEIVIKLTTSGTTTNNAMGLQYQPQTWDSGLLDPRGIITTGNMIPQYDIVVVGEPVPTWASYSQIVSGDPDDVPTENASFVLIIHVKPGTPYGGESGGVAINNSIIIPILQETVENQTPAIILSGDITITEYTQMANPGAPPIYLNSAGVVTSILIG